MSYIDEQVAKLTAATNDLSEKLGRFAEQELSHYPDTQDGFYATHMIMQGVGLHIFLSLFMQVQPSQRKLFLETYLCKMRDIAAVYLQMEKTIGQEDQKD